MKWVTAAFMGILLAACAQNQVFREGLQLLAEGQIEQGLARLEQASREAPQNVEYRAALFRQRELAISQLLSQAETARLNNDLNQAEALYLRVLRIEPGIDRARQGVEHVAMERRHRALMAEAQVLLDKNDRVGAEQKIRSVLSENRTHREALAMQRRIEEARVKDKPASSALKSSLSRSITLDFREAPLRSVFEVIARGSGVNYVFDRDVRPDLTVSVQLRNKSMDDAVRVILATNQLAQKVVDEDTVIIYPNVPAKQREYQDLSIRAFYLANADVKQVLNSIRTVIKTRDIFFDERLNALVMRDTPEAIRAAEKLVALLDAADPEVVLQLEVMEVSLSRLQDLGIRFPEQISAGVVGAAGIPGTITLPEWLNRNSSLVRLSVSDPALIINLRRLDSNTNVLANPQVRVRNRERARIHVGERVPVITTTLTGGGAAFATESVTYQDVGLRLELEPNIYLEDEVAMKVGLEVSNILETITRGTGTQVYRLGTRNASTTLRLRDGETQILAGLIQSDERRAANKVPGLGDLPVVGRLFTNNADNRTKTEIVLLITPRIVRNLARPQSDMAEFASGTEASLGAAAAGAGPGLIRPAPILTPPSPPAPAPAPAVPRAPGTPGIPGAAGGPTQSSPPAFSPQPPAALSPGSAPLILPPPPPAGPASPGASPSGATPFMPGAAP